MYALPTLAITPLYERATLDKWVSQASVDTAYIFVSRHAIHALGPSLPKAPGWPNLTCICLGPGSKHDLIQQGVPSECIVSPLCPPYETETLLAHPFFVSQPSKQRQYWLFRGPPGRTALQESIKAQGASLAESVLYDRVLPKLTPELRTAWERALTQNNTTLVSSAEGLLNLMERVSQLNIEPLKLRLFDQPLLVPSIRVRELAKSCGFRYIIETGSLETQSLINALKTLC